MRGTLITLVALLACDEPLAEPTRLDASSAWPRNDASVSIDAHVVPDARAPLEAGPSPEDGLTVRTRAGLVRGLQRGETRRWLGIPYAAPPTGALRFAPPLPVEPWAEHAAVDFGPSCPQLAMTRNPGVPRNAQSEDCLSLNVFAPATAQRAPVMVFLHGGGTTTGGSAPYPGDALSAAGDVVVVTVNYRLGVLGFLAHSALDAALDVPSGNMGLRDQQLALHWVHDNIAAFGGNPDNVTLFGESAGGISACEHMFMPESRALVKRFLFESGACVGSATAPRQRANLIEHASLLVSELCAEQDALTCLRALPPDAFLHWREKTSPANDPVPLDWGAHVDGLLIPRPPMEMLRAGELPPTEVLLGSNQHEWAFMQLFGYPAATNSIDWFFWVNLLFPSDASAITEHYFADTASDANGTFVRMITDQWFRCPARALARELVAHGSRVFLYQFSHAPAVHSNELDYVFGVPFAEPLYPEVARHDPKLVETMQGAWTRFARTGDPSDAQLPWPRYDGAHLELDSAPRVERDLAQRDCDFWDARYTHTATLPIE